MAALSFLFLLAQVASPGAAQPAAPHTEPRATVAPAPAEAADAVTRWRPYTREASRRFGMPLAWIERVMRAESGGRTSLYGRPIASRAGAMGLMQIMPATWAELRGRLGLGTDPHDPRDNILAGTFYLRLMYDRFGYPGLFGAYNAGPKRYAEWLSGGRALPAETRAYLAQVAGPMPAQGRVQGGSPATSPPVLFAIRYDTPPATPAAPAESAASLFVTLSTPARAGDARD